ncbi:ATP-dependent DNA helicase Q-like SIM isoform X6 [Asparagus officinalis]|uniref:ATP-dependent DNA helicase Q-like SIM isoform X6 n=1 Tax=Asparagus officinalis TaxID=4686 RepID=UPI00098DF2C0|nr:ATP-dependent DNA helicase Q-like SIM isoform X6 [Asparagus officinalis]
MGAMNASRCTLLLINMGFEFDQATKAVEAVGPSVEDAVEFILNGSCDGNTVNNSGVSSLNCSTSQMHPLREQVSPLFSSCRARQPSITEHISSSGKRERSNLCSSYNARSNDRFASIFGLSLWDSDAYVDRTELKAPSLDIGTVHSQEISRFCSSPSQEIDLGNWEQKACGILRKHFGFSSLKSFQKEAMEAWLARRDCLVLAATGSGKSLCFQIPALLTGKVVVVISPLISLMRDQCLKLAKHGISACFLGSGQPDHTVECKAMSGMYQIIYVCPETVLRLIEPLTGLAESHGIALFAIDEAHCVSNWGHDFRPDYRQLAILRENFSCCNLEFLKFDIPLMALTATATIPVREDIIKSLHMSKETKTVLTSFFRPNLRFSVKHSQTTSPSSYDKDFRELVESYAIPRGRKRKRPTKILNYVEDGFRTLDSSPDDSSSDADEALVSDSSNSSSDDSSSDDSSSNASDALVSDSSDCEGEHSEGDDVDIDEVDDHQCVDDLDVSCGEFLGNLLLESSVIHEASDMSDPQETLHQDPTIVYVPTRKETTKIAEYLSRAGVSAAAYHSKLPKAHLRQVHQEFLQNSLQVVVATCAFGMGIDKSNVRRIIHYGWPQVGTVDQSLEAYYQEAGRAGRDGKLADCTLYANLSRVPTLLPSQRSEEQTKRAYKMLSDCYRYGMNTAACRAKTLVKYFGEEFSYDKCKLCDVCISGPPKMQNLIEEAATFMHILKVQSGNRSFGHVFRNGAIFGESSIRRPYERANFKMLVSKIRGQEFSTSDLLWWRGLARILQDKGFIREGDELARVAINYPELTELGLKFLNSKSEQLLYVCPEADMLLSARKSKPYSSFAKGGRDWASPDIRCRCLQGRKGRPRKKPKPRKQRADTSTGRGRLSVKVPRRKL